MRYDTLEEELKKYNIQINITPQKFVFYNPDYEFSLTQNELELSKMIDYSRVDGEVCPSDYEIKCLANLINQMLIGENKKKQIGGY